MAHYADNTPCDYFGPYPLMAIGWLEPGQPYDKGALDVAFVRALVALATDPFQPIVFRGGHRCGFCRLSGGSGFRYENQSVPIGWANLFVPDGERLFVAPSMILHYMDAHEYAPAANFQRAVLACPPMRSSEYKRAFLKAGGGSMLRPAPDS
jgi:hypothetical protein